MTINAQPTRTQGTAAPVRGTQSLVGVMAFVFKHPSLVALELLWRWLVLVPLVFLGWHTLAPVFATTSLDKDALEGMTFMEPVRSAAVLAHQLQPFRQPFERTLLWWLPLAVLAWSVVATVGRTAILRRAGRLWAGPESMAHKDRSHTGAPQTTPTLLASAFDTLLRALAFVLLLAAWLRALLAAVRSTVTHRLYAGAEPNLVLLTAEAVGLTLAAFLLWSTTVWLVDLRPVERLTGLRAPGRQLRSKLIETNLVMGIVRVILLVLALTFSASPLPFQSQETQAFINVWWGGVAIFYVLSSDFFHVVRRFTYLRLLQATAASDAALARPA